MIFNALNYDCLLSHRNLLLCGAYLRWRQLPRPGVAPGPPTSGVLQLSVANSNTHQLILRMLDNPMSVARQLAIEPGTDPQLLAQRIETQ
jgi:hypothetical protein